MVLSMINRSSKFITSQIYILLEKAIGIFSNFVKKKAKELMQCSFSLKPNVILGFTVTRDAEICVLET